MDIHRAVDVLEALGNGVDPTTGEVLPAQSLYNSPEIIRALLCCTHFIKHPARKTRKTPEQKQADNLAKGLPRNASMPWTEELKAQLSADFGGGVELSELAEKYERTRGSIISELRKQGLITDEEARSF